MPQPNDGGLTVVAEPGSPTITTTRQFTAPPELVFRAFTEPDLIKSWLGPARFRMEVDEYDLRDGGRWRYRHIDPETGEEYLFHGVFHGDAVVDRPMVQTFEFAGFPGAISLDRLTLTPHDGGTLAETHSVHLSVQARDGMIAGGMEGGMTEGYQRLDILLDSLVPATA